MGLYSNIDDYMQNNDPKPDEFRNQGEAPEPRQVPEFDGTGIEPDSEARPDAFDKGSILDLSQTPERREPGQGIVPNSSITEALKKKSRRT